VKSYEARLLVLQLAQRRHGVPTSNEPGQEAPDAHETEAFVLAQKAALERKSRQAGLVSENSYV
jgi:hypothetical protein